MENCVNPLNDSTTTQFDFKIYHFANLELLPVRYRNSQQINHRMCWTWQISSGSTLFVNVLICIFFIIAVTASPQLHTLCFRQANVTTGFCLRNKGIFQANNAILLLFLLENYKDIYAASDMSLHCLLAYNMLHVNLNLKKKKHFCDWKLILPIIPPTIQKIANGFFPIIPPTIPDGGYGNFQFNKDLKVQFSSNGVKTSVSGT